MQIFLFSFCGVLLLFPFTIGLWVERQVEEAQKRAALNNLLKQYVIEFNKKWELLLEAMKSFIKPVNEMIESFVEFANNFLKED